jgi:hypothetical protein
MDDFCGWSRFIFFFVVNVALHLYSMYNAFDASAFVAKGPILGTVPTLPLFPGYMQIHNLD